MVNDPVAKKGEARRQVLEQNQRPLIEEGTLHRVAQEERRAGSHPQGKVPKSGLEGGWWTPGNLATDWYEWSAEARPEPQAGAAKGEGVRKDISTGGTVSAEAMPPKENKEGLGTDAKPLKEDRGSPWLIPSSLAADWQKWLTRSKDPGKPDAATPISGPDVAVTDKLRQVPRGPSEDKELAQTEDCPGEIGVDVEIKARDATVLVEEKASSSVSHHLVTDYEKWQDWADRTGNDKGEEGEGKEPSVGKGQAAPGRHQQALQREPIATSTNGSNQNINQKVNQGHYDHHSHHSHLPRRSLPPNTLPKQHQGQDRHDQDNNSKPLPKSKSKPESKYFKMDKGYNSRSRYRNREHDREFLAKQKWCDDIQRAIEMEKARPMEADWQEPVGIGLVPQGPPPILVPEPEPNPENIARPSPPSSGYPNPFAHLGKSTRLTPETPPRIQHKQIANMRGQQQDIVPCIMSLERSPNGGYRGSLHPKDQWEQSVPSFSLHPHGKSEAGALENANANANASGDSLYVDLEFNKITSVQTFAKRDEPDRAEVISNNNGWFIENDEVIGTREISDRIFINRWTESLLPVPSETEINQVMYRPASGNGPASGRSGRASIASSYFIDDLDDEARKEPAFEHWYCDVDTVAGTIMKPCDYPETMPASTRNYDPERKNWTVEYRYAEYKSKLKDATSQPRQFVTPMRTTEAKVPVPSFQDSQVATQAPASITVADPTTAAASVPAADPVSTALAPAAALAPAIPTVACIVRPATLADMVEVARIYNAEVNGDGMTPDAAEVDVITFEEIFDDCTNQLKPFVVAVRENALKDATHWPNQVAYQEYMRWIQEQGRELKDEIVGFGYLYPFDHGIWGSEGNATMSAKIRCFVDPAQRRRGIGRSLIDIMLSFTVNNYASKGGYEWRAGGNAGGRLMSVYNTAASQNARKYHRVFLEVYIKTANVATADWLRKFAEEGLGFLNMGHIWQGYRNNRGAASEWYDKIIWGLDCDHPDQELLANVNGNGNANANGNHAEENHTRDRYLLS